MNDLSYLIPSQLIIFEEEIKKSVFITYLAHTSTIEEAKLFIDTIKRKHNDARHNCWAFVAGRPDDSMKWGFSDDGEPSGTAGKPILAQLSGSGVGEITAVVTRYYGGIKLGTGGLVKAYGGGVQQALKKLSTIEKKITRKVQLELDYSFLSIAHTIMEQFDAQEICSEYDMQVKLLVEIENKNFKAFHHSIVNRSGAKIIVTP